MPEITGTRPLSWWAEQAPNELWGEDMGEEKLAPVIETAMEQCRKDLGRMMGDCDFCADCPLLQDCTDDDAEEREIRNAEWCDFLLDERREGDDRFYEDAL